MKIIYNKIYVENEHVATISFGQLIVKTDDKDIIKKLKIQAFKLNLELITY
tara:strand:+ start:18035 stop:18187 length:153 start_codon:yes stop_codon:yes gene_type:complete